jgi:hypothetical protein
MEIKKSLSALKVKEKKPSQPSNTASYIKINSPLGMVNSVVCGIELAMTCYQIHKTSTDI